jgi:hypothetical protein
MGLGVGIILLGFVLWSFTNYLLSTFIYWGDQIPLICTVVMVLGLVFLLIGANLGRRKT